MAQRTNVQRANDKNKKILLVEDNACLREIVSQILTDDYRITEAESGEEAIEALQSKDFDLVITDLNMGEVNGIEVLKKAKELNPETMVIIMTANHDVTYYHEALDLAACGYLLKPFKLTDLLERVSQCLRKRESTAGKGKSIIHTSGSKGDTVNV